MRESLSLERGTLESVTVFPESSKKKESKSSGEETLPTS
jgi:hypothetical protein